MRHAAIEALGNIGDKRAVPPLSLRDESSWLLRFALIEALAQLGSVEGLVAVLKREMNRDQMRNPVFSAQKDPLLEVEYSQLMEIGVLAFEKTGDLDGLLTQAEGNAWEEEADEENDQEEEYAAEGFSTGGEDEYDADDEDMEADEDLESYVDEVAQMASLALERLATPRLPTLDVPSLRRLAAIPDLSLLELSGEDDEGDGQSDGGASEPELTVIHDLSALREAAQAELSRR